MATTNTMVPKIQCGTTLEDGGSTHPGERAGVPRSDSSSRRRDYENAVRSPTSVAHERLVVAVDRGGRSSSRPPAPAKDPLPTSGTASKDRARRRGHHPCRASNRRRQLERASPSPRGHSESCGGHVPISGCERLADRNFRRRSAPLGHFPGTGSSCPHPTRPYATLRARTWHIPPS